jgi:hypothetical protein
MSKDAMSILMQALLRTYVFISLEYIPGDSTFLDTTNKFPKVVWMNQFTCLEAVY